MGNRLNGGKLLGLGAGLLFLTVVSTFIVFAAALGSGWEPDEKPASYWEKQIPIFQWIMAIAMLLPAASAGAAIGSVFALPRRPVRIIGAVLVTALALTAFFTSWWLGDEAVESAKYWANWYPGAPRRLR
ncbi:MAG: hypothetical protein JWQ56_2129 [Pseudarthrobacter sp.]|nr:hypothetical protein [Pseudarthrobacter sp.]